MKNQVLELNPGSINMARKARVVVGILMGIQLHKITSLNSSRSAIRTIIN